MEIEMADAEITTDGIIFEVASPELARHIKGVIALDMATALQGDHVDIDDDAAVAHALFGKNFSSIAIAHLMDDAKAIVRGAIAAAVSTPHYLHA